MAIQRRHKITAGINIKLVTAHAVQLIHFRMHMHLQMQSRAAHVPKIISGLNSAAATQSSLSVAVHTHTLSLCALLSALISVCTPVLLI